MSFDSKRLSHAYITDTDSSSEIAMAVVCSARDTARPCMRCTNCDKASRHIHPDITVVGKLEDKHIVSVDQIRQIKQDVYIVPNEATQKVYVVNDADSMNASAQNAFLQVLEEPPAHAVFILSTENPAALLPTVRSRCIELKSQPTTASTLEITELSADERSDLEELVDEFITALDSDNVKLMECMFRLDKLDRLTFSDFLTLAREHVALSLRETASNSPMKANKILADADGILIKAGEMLDLNVSTGHISGFICASLI